MVLSSGILYTADQTVADGLYQSERALDGTVIVIGITGEDLENFGVWPWDRSIMAAVLETLNRDEELRPAAIGVDTLYVSHTNPESDAALVEAAKAGNVVLACSAEFDSTLQFAEDGNAYMDDFSLQALDLPFPELREQAVLGHINAMYDVDGVLRHHLWAIPDGNGGEILSMPWQLYSMYCGYWGEEPDYTPALNHSGFWYVDYSAKPGTYLEYSVSDILSDNYDPYLLSGAIVLIGPYDPALTDSFIAPIEHAEQMYGVEYMANVTSAMLNGTVKKEVSDILQVILVTVLCFLLVVGFAHLRMLFMVPGFVVITAGMVGVARLLYLQGRVVHPLWFPLGAIIGFVVAVIEHYAVAAGDKKAIRNVFGRYVDPHIMHDLLREDSDSLGLEGKSCDIAVLFVDIRGFTSMSEGMAPEQVVKILNEYLTLTSDSVRKNGGTLDKFVGDCTMAFWGAPMPCEDPIYQACCAARDMVEGSKELGKRLEEQFGRSVAFGIGVHYGPAVVGNIGSDFRMDYTAIGDTVNTASRLESNAPKGTIYVSRAVVDALGDRADVTKTGPIHLKGKTDGFEIFTLDHLR
ncbi:MAG: adenylate/guanylate cyclase domain-containing protein [Oscillospiraceae bacterium]|nr:adenylate/guanylate cyclase domain-containing protein [Oscillospiraceae bacterium]